MVAHQIRNEREGHLPIFVVACPYVLRACRQNALFKSDKPGRTLLRTCLLENACWIEVAISKFGNHQIAVHIC